jgi:hypothetical protein
MSLPLLTVSSSLSVPLPVLLLLVSVASKSGSSGDADLRVRAAPLPPCRFVCLLRCGGDCFWLPALPSLLERLASRRRTATSCACSSSESTEDDGEDDVVSVDEEKDVSECSECSEGMSASFVPAALSCFFPSLRCPLAASLATGSSPASVRTRCFAAARVRAASLALDDCGLPFFLR